MAIVSSHILDSVTGKSAAGIRVQLFKVVGNEKREVIFDIAADKEGRIHEAIEATGHEYELVFHAAEYFFVEQASVTKTVIRFIMHDKNRRYHMPIMLAPHSYSVWWSD